MGNRITKGKEGRNDKTRYQKCEINPRVRLDVFEKKRKTKGKGFPIRTMRAIDNDRT